MFWVIGFSLHIVVMYKHERGHGDDNIIELP